MFFWNRVYICDKFGPVLHYYHTIFIGGHPDEKHPSNVFLANFEIYGKSFTLGTNLTFLPNDMIGLIDENFRDRIS